MLEKIREKLDSYVNAIIEKPAITQEEFCTLRFYLERLEYEAAQTRMAAEREASDKRFRDMVSLLGGEHRGV